MRIASDSAGDLWPYAMFRKCPEVVSQRKAKDSLSAGGIDFQNVLKSTPNYHHTVIEKATPNGEFTNWSGPANNEGMENSMARIRRANLARLIDRDYGGNASAIARAHDPENPKPNYFSDLLRENSGKSFGEKAARRIEQSAGLVSGQLDIPNSPLKHDQGGKERIRTDLMSTIDELGADEMREALAALRKIQAKRWRKRA